MAGHELAPRPGDPTWDGLVRWARHRRQRWLETLADLGTTVREADYLRGQAAVFGAIVAGHDDALSRMEYPYRETKPSI